MDLIVLFLLLFLIVVGILMAWVFRPPNHQLKQKPKTTETRKTPPNYPLKNISSDNKYRREQLPKKTESLKIPSERKKRKIRTGRHQMNINQAESVLKWLRTRSPEAELPVVIAVLRRLTPYVLRNCC